MRNHHEPRPSIIVQRFKFNTCSRKQGDSVASFVAELRRLTEHCDFGITLEDMLRDRLVCGINEPTLQRHLLAQDKLMFKTALKVSQAWESAGHHVQDLQQSQLSGHSQLAATDVHAVQQHRQDRHDRHDCRDRTDYAPCSNTGSCNSCGGPHQRAGCRYRSAVCNNCGKKGHLAWVCRSNVLQNTSPTPRSASTVQTHQVQTAESLVEVYPLFTIANKETRPVVVTLRLDDRQIDMDVDTGVTVNWYPLIFGTPPPVPDHRSKPGEMVPWGYHFTGLPFSFDTDRSLWSSHRSHLPAM